MTTASPDSPALSFFERLERNYGDPPKSVREGQPPYRNSEKTIKSATNKFVLLYRASRANISTAIRFAFDIGSFIMHLINVLKWWIIVPVLLFGFRECIIRLNANDNRVRSERQIATFKVIDRYWACIENSTVCTDGHPHGIVCDKKMRQISGGIENLPAQGCTGPNVSTLSYLILKETTTMPNVAPIEKKIWVDAPTYSSHPIGSTYFACVNGFRAPLAWMGEPKCPDKI